MTPAQIDLLQRLITADRLYRSRVKLDIPSDPDWRGIEVGSISGVDKRTANSLVEAGLAEMVDIHGRGHAYIFLGKYEPYDTLEDKDMI